MKHAMKHAGTAIAATLAFATTAHADTSDAQMRNLENRVSALEQKKGANGMINPSGRPQVKDGADLFFTGDWLIWQAHENGLSYAVKADNTTSFDKSSVDDLHFDWDFGFRVGLGYNTAHDGWDLYANWTWFQNHAHGSVHVPSTERIYPVQASAGDIASDTATKSHAHWRLALNMIDLEMGREFFVSKWMTLRPFVGVRNAWVRQKLHIDYEHLLLSGVADSEEIDCRFNNNYWGIGLRPGLNTQWGLGHGFSFYGNTAFSLLYGFFSLDQDETNESLAGVTSHFMDNDQSYRVGRAIAEIQLGLRWEHMFANDHAHFSIQGGWENFMFFGQNQFKRFVTSSSAGIFAANQGDLTIQGWTLAMRLDF